MLRYLYAADLHRAPLLADSMFRDRAAQFRDRLDWEVDVDARGWERDAYDAMGPLYVIWQQPDGRHGGSLRFLPTMGPTMARDHFAHLGPDAAIRSRYIWECTRFCLAPGAGRRVSAALLLGGLEIGLRYDLSHAVGVFDTRMIRVYSALKWPPAILGTCGEGPDALCLGLWSFERERRATLLARSHVSEAQSQHWLQASLGPGRSALAGSGRAA